MEDNKTRVLYDRLTQDGYDIGDFDSFSKNVQDETKRKSLYETITNDGYDVGDFDSFSSKLVARSQEEPVTNVTTQNVQPEQLQVQPVQDMPSYDPKTQGYILDNVPDMFRSKGNNLATRPLPQQDLFENNPSDLVRKIGIDQQQRVEQAQKSANDPYMKEQNLELFKRQNQEQINSVNELINAARQERAKERQQRVRSVGDGGIFSTTSQAYLAGEQNDTDKQLEYASTLMEQAQNITNEAKKKGNTNFFAGFARGFKDAPLDGWAMGLQDLKNYSAAKKVMDKVDKGEELTPSEDALMQALVTNAATQMYYSGDLGRGYKAGGVTAESLPFMLDMIAGMGAVQALTKPASKAIVKYSADKAAQMGLGRATTGLAKGAARTVAGLGDVAAHTATFGNARVAADYQRRGLGDVQVKPNADGTVSYDGRENVQTGAEALGKSIISTAAETGSELLGEYFAPMLGYIGRVTGANKVGKIIPASVGKAFKDVVNSQGFREMQEIARRAKISDPLGEYAEEVANNLVSTAIGDMTPEQLVDLDQNIDTFLGVAPMSALFGAAGTGGYLRDKYKNYRNMRNFETQMQDAMGEDWSGVREALQDADIETARNMVKDVLSSPMSPDMKKNAIKYISSVLQEQTLQEADKQMMPEEIAVQKRNIINNLNETRSRISLNDEELNSIINSEEGYQAIISQFDPETANNIMKYKQAYDDFVNYNYWVQDQADNARRQAEAQVESLTNATTGTIMRVNNKLTKNPVNVLRGNLVFDNEGKVDENQSDKTIYYMSEDGRVKMAPVSMFSSLVDNTPAEEMIQRAGNDAQEEVLQAEEAQINSIPAQEQQPIGPETRFTMGRNNYEVNRVTPDGYEVYLLDKNGTPAQSQLMSEEEIRNAINGQQPANAEETQPSVTEQTVQEETSEQPVQENQTAMSRIPLNERGEQDFEAAPVADTSAALLEISDNVDDAKDTVTQMIEYYNNELKKVEKKKSSGNTIQGIIETKKAKKAINDKISYWNQVSADLEAKRPTGLIAQAEEKAKENQQRLASMTAEEQQAAQQEVQKKIDAGAFERKEPRKKVRYVKEDADLGPSITPQEHVLREIATGRVSFSLSDAEGAQGLSSHLGYSNSPEERKKLVWALSSDGLTPEAAAEQIHADMPENLQGMVTDQDVFNMIINAFQEYGSPSKMWDAAKNMHGTDIEENIPGYEEDQERQLIEWEASENRMSVPEWIAYSDYIEEELNNLYSSVTDEELNTIFEQIINDYERRAETESAGSTEGQTDSEQGNTVQPERKSDNEGRTGEVEEQPEPANKTDGESGSVVPEPEGTVDNNGYPFLKSSNETTIFGEIREETGLTPAPIKLSEGFNRKDEKGRNHGYGFKHIEESYGDQIRNYGFESIPEFVESVAKNYTIVRKGNKRNGIDTYILEVSDKKNNTLFVELSKDGSYWNVNSAGVFRKGYSKKKEVVWPLPAVEDASTAEDTGVQNAADSSNSMSGNSPQNASFVDKDTQSLEEKQEDKKKFTASEINQGEGVIEYAQRIAKEKEIWDESQKVDINPTEGQKEAGNYKMGHVKVDGMDITIENPKGSVRSGKDANGKEWSVTMNNTYGYIRGTRGVDGDHIDIFLSDNPESGNVYVIDQVDQQTGMYDESKVMYGFNSIDEAKDAYLSNYEEGWKVGVISEVSKEEFKKWIESSTNKIKPFSEYKNIDFISAQNDGSAKDIQPANEDPNNDESNKKAKLENSEDVRFREDDIVKISGGRNIKFTRKNPTNTFNALVKYLESEDIKINDISKAKTGSKYVSFEINGVSYDVRAANHTKGYYGKHENSTGVTVYWKDNINGIDVDLSENEMGIDDIKQLISDVEKFNSNENISYNSFIEKRENPYDFIGENSVLANQMLKDMVYDLKKEKENLSDNNTEEIEKINNLISQASQNVLFRFIGEQGAANLDAAEEANTRLDNLAVAREMEKSGKSAKSIKIATGWERGADNKWRYEEEDFEYIPKGNAREKSLLEREPWHKELMSLSDKVYNGEKLSNEEEVRFDELSKKETELKDSLKKSDIKFLDDYVSDNTLFKEYPELKQVKVEFYDGSFFDGGSYSHHDMTIRINNNSPLDAKSILVHEVQHAIQHIEGFSRGGNSRTYRNYLNSIKEKRDAWSMIDEFEEKSKELGSDASQMDVYKAVRDEYTSLGMSFGDGIMPSRDAFDKGFNLWVRGYDKEGYEDAYKEYQNLIEKFGLGESKDRYHELSGEVEARNVQSRLNMTPEERRKALASETEDVAREDQIFLYDSMSANSMTIDENQDLNNIKSEDVEETSKKLNVPVEVITSVDQIKDNSVRSAIEKGRKVKGWYSLSDNKVYVYLPNATSMEDVNQTILHEGVAHYGLRQLVGEDRMDDFLDDVFANVTDEVRKKIIDTLPRYGYNSRIATEEYMARMAENGVDVSVWQRIKQAFNSLMRRMGINIKISDNELRYILWRSRQNLDKNKPLDLAKDVSMQYQMGVGNYFREDTDGSIGMYEQSLKGWKYKAQEAYQDSMLALKNLQEVIAKVSGKPIKSFENAYMAENQLSSKNTSEAEVYYKKHYQPMLQEAGKMMKKYGLTQKGIERYMMLAHGIERNVELTFREQLDEVIKNNPDDADQFIQDFKDEKERLRKLYSGYEYLKELSDYIGGVNDYSATQAILNSMDGEEHENFQEDALNYVKDFEQTYDVKELWNKTNDATKTTLRKAYDSGMMGKEQYSNVNNMYMYYVPLRGWDEQTAEDVYEYIDSERNPVSSVLKSAKGRKSIPDEIFATIGNMAESAIMQGNRNMMKQSFMSMVINHPTDIATLKKAWYVYDPVKDEWNISMPDIQESDNAETIAEKLKNHEEQMKQLKENGLATQKPNGLNINYRINKNNISQHVVQVKNGGKDYVIYINGNPRAAQAINGLTNPNVEQNPIFRSIATANRWLAANFTTRNPAFVLSNLVRDLIFSNVAVSIKEDGKYSSRFRKNILKAMPVVLRNLNGKPNNTEADRYFQEFIENGGETGYMHLNDVEKYKKKVRKELSKINGEMGSAKMAMDFAIDRLEDFNRWAEDISRFTTYMTSRQMGRSITESVNDAKEVTVNFNKKGAGYKTGGFFGITSGIFRNLYLFFNASVQSLTNFKRLYDKQPVKFYSALGGFMSAGFLMPMINNVLYSIFGGGDDDPYNDLPEWVRRNNLCIYTGNDTFLTIPLPIELRAFYGLGDYAYQLTTGKEKPSATNIAKGTVGQLADLLPLNPTGNEGLKTFMPDIMSPIFEAYIWNQDFTGKPVAKISPFNERDPEWKRVYKGTSGWLVDTSKFLNDISNGSGPGSEFRKGFIDFNPAKVEHLLESYFGGMAKTFNQAGKTIYYGGKSLIEQQKDEDLVMRNVPIANRFLNTVDERNAFSGINTEYFNLRDEMDQFKYELNGVKKSGNKDEYKEMLNSDLYDKYQKYKPYQKKLKKLNDMAKESQGEDRKEIEDMIIETRRELLEEVK